MCLRWGTDAEMNTWNFDNAWLSLDFCVITKTKSRKCMPEWANKISIETILYLIATIWAVDKAWNMERLARVHHSVFFNEKWNESKSIWRLIGVEAR